MASTPTKLVFEWSGYLVFEWHSKTGPIEHVWIPTVLTFRRSPTSEPSRSALEAAESELWKIVHSVATTATTAPAATTAPTAPTVTVKGKG